MDLVNGEGGLTSLNIQHVGRKDENEAMLAAIKEVDGFAVVSSTISTVSISSTVSYQEEASPCPLGQINSPCEPCPEGMTTLHRGSTDCTIDPSEQDLLGMFYDLMDGECPKYYAKHLYSALTHVVYSINIKNQQGMIGANNDAVVGNLIFQHVIGKEFLVIRMVK